ncbi:MAG: hypothetical protein R2764_10850 [Bacteroidales bacterium]
MACLQLNWIGQSFPANNFFNGYGDYITFFVGGEEMSPRQQFQAVPFSIRSKNAEYANETDQANYAFAAGNADKLDNISSEFFVQQDASENATISSTMSASAFVGDGHSPTYPLHLTMTGLKTVITFTSSTTVLVLAPQALQHPWMYMATFISRVQEVLFLWDRKQERTMTFPTIEMFLLDTKPE